jgi:uncharacterized protein
MSSTRLAFFSFGLPLLLLAACAPTINVATPDPVKIDINMNVDVKSPPMPAKTETAGPGVAERRRLRMGEVQEMKNARVIGEDRDAYLKVVERPKEEGYAAYVDRVIAEENRDRVQLYMESAKQKGQPLEITEQAYAKLWAERAYPGEYIQAVDGQWTKK